MRCLHVERQHNKLFFSKQNAPLSPRACPVATTCAQCYTSTDYSVTMGDVEALPAPKLDALAATPKRSTPSDASAAAIVNLLRKRRPYARLVASEILSALLNWFSYLAVLRAVSAAAPPRQASLLVGVATAFKYLPGILFPVTGWVADRFPRELVLAASAAASGLAVAVQALVAGSAGHAGPHRARPAAILALVLLQNFANSFYDPARAALTPRLVARRELRLASTIDTVVWSACQALGAAVGGVALSKLGPSFCFALDASFYMVCAAAALSLRGHADRPIDDDDEETADGEATCLVPAAPHPASIELAASKLVRFADDEERGDAPSPRIKAAPPPAAPRTPPRLPSVTPAASRPTGLSPASQRASAAPSRAATVPSSPAPSVRPPASVRQPATTTRTLRSSIAAAAADVAAGVAYCREHRHVAILASIKASGAVVWGSADFLNIAMAGTLATATLDADTIAGLLFGAVGIGCVVGSALANATVAYNPAALLRAVAAASVSIAAGYFIMAAASTSLLGASLASAVRSAGSSVLWSYSTLLLQLSVPDAFLGRVSALEQAAVSVARSCAIAAAAVFDAGGFSVAAAAAGLTVLGGVVAAWWMTYASRYERRERMAAGLG